MMDEPPRFFRFHPLFSSTFLKPTSVTTSPPRTSDRQTRRPASSSSSFQKKPLAGRRGDLPARKMQNGRLIQSGVVEEGFNGFVKFRSTPSYIDLERWDAILAKCREKNQLIGWEIPIDADATSGSSRDLEWDFSEELEIPIDKFGLVHAGINRVVWRRKEDLSEEFIFHINDLGVNQSIFTINF
ncbi:Glutamate decarboxylase 5 [Linum perenne]